MKNTLFILLLLILCFSCRKISNDNYPYKIDSNVYFKISFNNKTLVTNGLLHYDTAISHYAILNTYNSSVGKLTDFSIFISGSSLNTALKMAGYNYPPQQCDVFLSLTKTGDALGNYKVQNYVQAFISDIENHVNYKIDPSNSVFSITSADASYITGTFNCNLGGGLSNIPATGTFKLKQ